MKRNGTKRQNSAATNKTNDVHPAAYNFGVGFSESRMRQIIGREFPLLVAANPERALSGINAKLLLYLAVATCALNREEGIEEERLLKSLPEDPADQEMKFTAELLLLYRFFVGRLDHTPLFYAPIDTPPYYRLDAYPERIANIVHKGRATDSESH